MGRPRCWHQESNLHLLYQTELCQHIAPFHFRTDHAVDAPDWNHGEESNHQLSAYKADPLPLRYSSIKMGGFDFRYDRPNTRRPLLQSRRLSAADTPDQQLRELRVSPDAHPIQEHILPAYCALSFAHRIYLSSARYGAHNRDRESNPGLLRKREAHSPLCYHGIYCGGSILTQHIKPCGFHGTTSLAQASSRYRPRPVHHLRSA